MAKASPATHTYTHRPLQSTCSRLQLPLFSVRHGMPKAAPHSLSPVVPPERQPVIQENNRKNELLAGYFLNYILKLHLGGHMSVCISSP